MPMSTIKERSGNTYLQMGLVEVHIEDAQYVDGDAGWIHGTVVVAGYRRATTIFRSNLTFGCYLEDSGGDADAGWSVGQEGARILATVLKADQGMMHAAFPEECEAIGREAQRWLRWHWGYATCEDEEDRERKLRLGLRQTPREA